MKLQMQRTEHWDSACYFLLILILSSKIDFTEALTWTTETLSVTGCEGQDTLLAWNFSTGENDIIRQLHWYYNTITPICFKSESFGFNVGPLYEGRVEQYGSSGIRLKKMSPIDTGEYSLYLKLAEERNRTEQTIFLTVYEKPKAQCKPVISIQSKEGMSCYTNSCRESHLLTEWRIEGIRNPVGNESYLKVDSSWNGRRVLCCSYGPSIECHNVNQSEVCTSTAVSSTDEGLNYGHTEDTVPVPFLVFIAFVSVCLLIILIGCYRKRTSKFYEENLHRRPSIVKLRGSFQIQDSKKTTDAYCDSNGDIY